MTGADDRITTVASDSFVDARGLGRILSDLLSDAAVAEVGLGTRDVVYVVAPDGTVCHRARLVRERLTDGSAVFNMVLG